jgi:hypothetical protein
MCLQKLQTKDTVKQLDGADNVIQAQLRDQKNKALRFEEVSNV